MYVCVYIYIYIHACNYTCMHIYIYVYYIYECTYIIYVYMYNTYIYTYVRSMFVASDTRLLKALLEQVQALAHELAPGHVTSVLWALAKLRQKPTNSLFAALSQRVSTMSLCLVPGDISTIMWSLTMLGMEADAVTNSEKSSFRHFHKYVVIHHAWHRGRVFQ